MKTTTTTAAVTDEDASVRLPITVTAPDYLTGARLERLVDAGLTSWMTEDEVEAGNVLASFRTYRWSLDRHVFVSEVVGDFIDKTFRCEFRWGDGCESVDVLVLDSWVQPGH
jgi:hypothetical protein